MSGRFILIDPSIEGFTGHHLEYAVHVLRAAEQAGFDPTLVTNRRFSAQAETPFATYRQYKYDFWSRPFLSGRNGWLKGVYRFFRNSAERNGNTAGSPSERWGGSCTATPEATGATVQLSPQRAELSPQRTALARMALWAARCWRARFSDPIRARQFGRDTADLLKQLRVTAADLVFVPGAGDIELAGLLRTFRRVADAGRAQWHLVFRRDPPQHTTGAAQQRLVRAFEHLRAHAAAGNVRFYADTEELSRQYEELAGLPFRTLPIPHTHAAPRPPRAPAGPLHILYLGDARKEKGFHHLPGIVRDLWADCVATGRVAWTIQSNPPLTDDEPEIRAAREQLRGLASDAVVVLTAALSSDQYRRLLLSGDIILLPYEQAAYRWRSSGILVEALAAGIPPIVPADTWLARQVPADVGVTYADIRQVPGLIREMIGQYDRYRAAALVFSEDWIRRHNAANLVDMLSAPRAGIIGVDTT
jgi:glycosyltransferase involved in cell wall biosynthesis